MIDNNGFIRVKIIGTKFSRMEGSKLMGPKEWNSICKYAVLLIVAIIVGMFVFPIQISIIGGQLLWLGSLILLSGSCAAIGYCIMGVKLGLLIDGRKKISLSRLQTVLWTIVIISGLLAATVLNLAKGEDPLNITIPSDLWFLMGITTASLVISPIIKNEKGDSLKKNTDIHQAQLRDLFKGEEDDNEDRLDLGKVQMFYLTIIIVFAYAVQIAHLLSSGKVDAFPPISSGMTALLGISNAGYLAYKAAPHVAASPETAA